MKPTILVVDDKEINRIILHEVLCMEYEVVEATDGMDVLEKIRDGVSPRIIITDLLMPVMDGYTLIEQLKITLPDVPIIVVTADDPEVHELKSYEAGAINFISKPYNGAVLKAYVDNLMKMLEVRGY